MSDSSGREITRRGFMTKVGGGLVLGNVAGGLLKKAEAQLVVPDPPGKKLGWAIVGLGSLSINQILPAFSQCEKSKVVALVSGHPDKANKLALRYRVSPKNIYNYQNYDSIKDNPEVDIIYIVLPNGMHAEYTVRGLQAGKHVLTEKPMANTPAECQQMIDAGRKANKKLMVAYRCRYEPYNQEAVRVARSQELGTVKAGEEPSEVNAMMYSTPNDPRFKEVEEAINFQLRFPSGILANCTSSYGYAWQSHYRVVTNEGWLEMDPATAYSGLRMRVHRGNVTEEKDFPVVDHFAAEMEHMSDCVMQNKEPLTPGEEGLRDLTIMHALYEAANTGKTVRL